MLGCVRRHCTALAYCKSPKIPLPTDAVEAVQRDGFCGFQLLNRMICRFGFDPSVKADDNKECVKVRCGAAQRSALSRACIRMCAWQ